MIIIKCKERLSVEMAAIVRARWEEAVASGKPIVLEPEFDIEEVNIPVISGPLVGYMAQLGDA